MIGKGARIPLFADHGARVAHARALFEILCDKSNPQRAGDAARHAVDALDQGLAENGPPPFALACRKGCSYCCHNWVTASAPEIFLLARSIRAKGDAAARPIAERVAAAAAAPLAANRAARLAGGQACALLAQDLCSAYTGRPLICRSYASASLAACIAAFEGGADKIPMPSAYLLLRGSHAQCLWAALLAAGYSDRSYELAQALARVLPDPEAEVRWLSGEDIFAGVAADEAADEGSAQATRALAEEIKAGAAG